MTPGRLIKIGALLASLAGALALFACAAAPAFAEGIHEAPHWDILSRSAPSDLAPGQKGEIVAVIINLGDAPVLATQSQPVLITDKLPAGLEATGAMEGYAARGDDYLGQKSATPLSGCEALPQLRCPYVGTLPPYIAIEVRIPVVARPSKVGEPAERQRRKRSERRRRKRGAEGAQASCDGQREQDAIRPRTL